MGFSIVIPTLGEESNLRVLLPALQKLRPSEIIVCDNGSQDRTVELAQQYPNVKVSKGMGSVGDAVLRGLRIAITSSRYIIVMDADGSHPPNAIPKMLDALQEHDMVVASRYKGGDTYDTAKNVLISRVGNLITSPLAPGISDRMSGFWGVRKEVVQEGNRNGVRPTAKLMLEYYIKGRPSSVAEVSYTFNPRWSGVSKIKRGWALPRTALHLTRLYNHKFNRIIKFVSVSGLGIAINLGTLFFMTEVIGIWYGLSACIAIAVGVTWNFSMHTLWTFGKCNSLMDFWNLGHKVEEADFEWWEWHGPNPVKRWWKRRVAELTLQLAIENKAAYRSVLILGCGSSPSFNYYHCSKVGIDINSGKVKYLDDHSVGEVFCGDITMPLVLPPRVPQEYDIVICNEVMEHLNSVTLGSVVNNISNLLAPGGRVVISVPDESSSKVGKWTERILHGDIHVPITMHKIKALMAQKGLVETGRHNHLWVQIRRFEKRRLSDQYGERIRAM